MKNYFQGYVGQEEVTNYANLLCSAVEAKRPIPLQPLLFTGYAGLGKTSFTRHLSTVLNKVSEAETGNIKDFEIVEISPAVSLPGLISTFLDNIAGKRVIAFFDEAHSLKNPKVINLLKRMLETENECREIRHEDYSLCVNPFIHQWVFATNEEPHDTALFGPTSRCKTLQFMPYTEEETIAIMYQKAKKHKMTLHKEAARLGASRTLHNGRAIKELIENDCLLRVNKNMTITLEVMERVVKETCRFPMGLRRADIQTLKFLGGDVHGKQVNEIASHCGGEDSKSTSHRLQWLGGFGFIRTHAGKKLLTAAGKEYLMTLARAQGKK